MNKAHCRMHYLSKNCTSNEDNCALSIKIVKFSLKNTPRQGKKVLHENKIGSGEGAGHSDDDRRYKNTIAKIFIKK